MRRTHPRDQEVRSSIAADVILGHFLVFEKPFAKLTGNKSSLQAFIAFLLTGFLLLAVLRQLSVLLTSGETPVLNEMQSRFATVCLLLAGTIAITKFSNRSNWCSQIFRPFRAWTRREVLYLVQVVPVACVAFFFVFSERIHELILQEGLVGFLVFNVVFGMLWGIYQEVTFRGLLQSATVTKFGPIVGILIANVAFTFGPLHFSHYPGLVDDPSKAWIFLPIFLIGLGFAAIYHRSGNIWIPAIFHGLWPLNW